MSYRNRSATEYNYGVPPIRYSSKRATTVFPEALVQFGNLLNLPPKFIFRYLMLKGCLKMSMHFEGYPPWIHGDLKLISKLIHKNSKQETATMCHSGQGTYEHVEFNTQIFMGKFSVESW